MPGPQSNFAMRLRLSSAWTKENRTLAGWLDWLDVVKIEYNKIIKKSKRAGDGLVYIQTAGTFCGLE